MIKNIITIPNKGTSFRNYEKFMQNYDGKTLFSLKKYSEYIPFYIINNIEEQKEQFVYHNFDNGLIKSIFEKTGIYYLFDYKNLYPEKLIYNDLLFYLKHTKYVYNYKLSDKISLQVTNNYIINNNNEILLCLGYKENKLDFLNDDNFKLFISTELINNPDYSNFYKKLYKEYILLFIKEGIKVEFLNEKNFLMTMFNNGVDYDKNFNSLDEINEFLKNKKIDSLLTFDIQEHKDFVKLEEENVEEENGVCVKDIESLVIEKDEVEKEFEEIFKG